MDIKQLPIDQIGLSVRSVNALHRVLVFTVEDMMTHTEETLPLVRNLGKKSINEILAKIDEYKAIEADGSFVCAPGEPKESEGTKKTHSGALDMKRLSIDDIGMSIRSTNVLHRYDIHTVEDMITQTEADLLCMRNLGRKSADEILAKIDEYRKALDNGAEEPADADVAEDELDWQAVVAYLENNNIETDALESLSTKTFNMLLFAGYGHAREIAALRKDGLTEIPGIDSASCAEISAALDAYVQEHKDDILEFSDRQKQIERLSQMPLNNLCRDEECQRKILKYVKAHDVAISDLGLPEKMTIRLLENGCANLSDAIFLMPFQLLKMQGIGAANVHEFKDAVNKYLDDNEARIREFILSEESGLLSDNELREMILGLYESRPFGGFSLGEMKESLSLPESVSQARLKAIIGKLLAENKLEYVDFRCYRVYSKFEDAVAGCPLIDERSQQFILRRLHGDTLEAISEENGLTRERVRQVVSKGFKQVDTYYRRCGTGIFDEDYYRYLYENYSFDDTAATQWFGISEVTLNYFDMRGVKQGTKDIGLALEDQQGLDLGLRLKIKNYLNRNKIFVDGMWIEKKRADIEYVVVKKFCTENTSFNDFARIYNDFLEQEEVEYDEAVYYTESVIRTRKNKLQKARFLLWKLNEQMRYYEIDGRDYSELLETLNLDLYENIELSTAKFVRDYPELMARYDIRDQYELHNLLKKIVDEGSYCDFHCGRMPTIRFGDFDRDAAVFDIMVDNAPISQNKLAELISDEYGYDPLVVASTYLTSLSAYLHRGVYSVTQKQMPPANERLLREALTEDFYYTSEIKKIYVQLIPGADPAEVNPYNLKNLGFQVFSKYVLQNYTSLEAYFEHLFTGEDIVDISPYRKRFTRVQSFSTKIMQLKRERQVIEFEPNKLINMRKLSAGGVTIEMIQTFCDDVYTFVDDSEYFSVRSLRRDGFISALDDLGFSDWFYANLLAFDGRFSFGIMFGCMVLYKGTRDITIRDFESRLIGKHGSIDTYELMSEMSDRFGCRIDDKWDVIYKVSGSEIYHDDFLDKLYVNKDAYYRELEEGGF